MCFLFFGCAGSSLLHGLFSSHGEWGLLSSCITRASHCGGLSCCGAQALGHVGSAAVAVPRLQSTSSVVVAQLLRGMWDLPDQGLNPCLLHWQALPFALCLCSSGSPSLAVGSGSTMSSSAPGSHLVHDARRLLLTKDQLTLLNQESAVCGSEAPRAAVWILTKLPPTLQLPVTWLLLTQMNP